MHYYGYITCTHCDTLMQAHTQLHGLSVSLSSLSSFLYLPHRVMYTHACMHTHIYTCMYAHKNTYTHMRANTYMHVHACARAHTHTHTSRAKGTELLVL